MRLFATRTRTGLVVGTTAAAAAAACFLGPSAFADAGPAALNAQFAGVFSYHACPAGSAAGDFCLTDHLTGQLPGAGAVTGTFEVDIHQGEVGSDNCGPIDKRGAFTTADGSRIVVSATGVICGGIASYRYTVEGGTGAYQDATGHGVWLIPPATAYISTGGNGPEILFGSFGAGQD